MIAEPRAPFANAAERELARRLDLWRLRGAAARQARQLRQLPRLQRATPNQHVALIAAAWFAGYDGR